MRRLKVLARRLWLGPRDPNRGTLISSDWSAPQGLLSRHGAVGDVLVQGLRGVEVPRLQGVGFASPM